jgi:predicted N-acetyltransferase YhbS
MVTTEQAGARAGSEPVAAGVELRTIRPADAHAVARILYEAFAGVHDHHRFARDFPTLESAEQLTAGFIAHPGIWGVVAEIDGRIVGSNFLDERGPVRGVGPITVDPAVQARGVGRRLMEAVIERGAGARGIRLLQDAFNTRSLALYASLGFDVREAVVVMGGRPRSAPPAGAEVRPLQARDIEACEALHRRVHGFERTAELRDALASPVLEPVVALRDGRIVAYATGVTFFAAAYGVAETQQDLFELIAGALAATEAPASFLLPARQGELLRACLAAGLEVVKPMTYMTLGEYREAEGAWLPSVLC